LNDRIERVRQLLREIHHISLATVNSDGTPHNTPVFAAFDDVLQGFWSSHPESHHSINVADSGRVFITLYDSRQGSGGLYIEASAHQITDEHEFNHALDRFNRARRDFQKSAVSSSNFQAPSPQRLYQAVPLKIWINTSERDEAGLVTRDRRHEITLAALQLV
jgi:hypothetical protein